MEIIMLASTASAPVFSPPLDSGIIELSLMLSRRQFDALEERAQSEGMSVAQFLRRLVSESIDEMPIGKSR
jgi:hypothetical protein